MPVNDRFLAGTFAALFKQLDEYLPSDTGASLQMVAGATAVYPLFCRNMGIPMRLCDPGSATCTSYSNN